MVLAVELSVWEVVAVLSLLCFGLTDSSPSALELCFRLTDSPPSVLVLCFCLAGSSPPVLVPYEVSIGVPWNPCVRLLKKSCEGGSFVILRVGKLWFTINSLKVSLYEPGTATFTE